MISLVGTVADVSQLLQAIFTGGLLIAALAAAAAAWAQLGRGQKAVATQIAAQLDNDRRLRAHSFADRTTTVEFVALMSEALKLFRLDEDTWRKWWSDRDLKRENEVLRQQAVVVLNFCEAIAGEYLDGLLDKKVADKDIAYVAKSIWLAAERFVKFYRCETNEQRAWDRLEAFAKQWRIPDA